MATAKRQSRKKRPAEDLLTEKAIKQRVGDQSFQRGRNYFESKAIFGCQRQGELLKARCRGQSADSYAVSAQIAGGKILATTCDCPVGSEGACKHVAALLLTWRHDLHEFHETASLETQLSGCSKTQLVQLIQQMIDREPDLESWLELALPTVTASGRDEVIKPDAYRRQVVAAFSNAGYGWKADQELTATLKSLQQIGDQFRLQRKIASAAAVYRGILEGFFSEYESFQDESGNVCVVVQECVTALGECLHDSAKDSEARASVLRTLFEVLRFDVNFGGIGLSDEVPEILIEQATEAEQMTVAGWIHAELPSDKEFSSSWRRETWGRLLLDLEGKSEDDEVYLKHCREFGLIGDLVERLLQRGRLPEALQEIAASTDYNLMELANQLIAHKHADLAHTLVRDRLSADRDGRNNRQLRDWLKNFYQTRKHWESLLDLLVEEFHDQPRLTQYQTIQKLAQKLKTWGSLRSDLLSSIPSESNERIRIHLFEKELDQAIALWEHRNGKKRNWSLDWDRVDLEVAQAAEKSHPETAIRIYCAEVKRLIDARGRQNYQSACGFLKKIRPLFKASGQNDWNDYISQLQKEYASLRALHEELKLARLSAVG